MKTYIKRLVYLYVVFWFKCTYTYSAQVKDANSKAKQSTTVANSDLSAKPWSVVVLGGSVPRFPSVGTGGNDVGSVVVVEGWGSTSVVLIGSGYKS